MTTLTVTEQTRSAVWMLLWDLERNVRYYIAKADQLQRLSYRIRFGLLVGVLIEALLAYPLSQFNLGWVLILAVGIVLAVLAIWDALSNHARDSGILKFTSLACDELKTEADELWRNIESYRIGTEEVETRYQSIIRRWEKATDKVLLATDENLNERCQVDANRVMESRYAI